MITTSNDDDDDDDEDDDDDNDDENVPVGLPGRAVRKTRGEGRPRGRRALTRERIPSSVTHKTINGKCSRAVKNTGKFDIILNGKSVRNNVVTK